MPYINIRTAGEPVSDDTAQRLMDEMGQAVDDLLGKKREVTAVSLEELPDARWQIAGTPVGKRTAYVEILITLGTNTTEEKAAMIAAATQLLKETWGDLETASYVVIKELPADSWGYDGRTQAARAQ